MLLNVTREGSLLTLCFVVATCAPPSHQPSSSSLSSNEPDEQRSDDDNLGSTTDTHRNGAQGSAESIASQDVIEDHAIIGQEESRSLPYAMTPLDRVRAAARILLEEGDPSVWGRDGQLTPRELSNPFLSTGLEGIEAFNVLDSNGYEGDYKCNLLAFELAYRAGLQVPLIGRGRGWGYPGPSVVIDQSEGGRMLELWASRVESTELEHLRSLLDMGGALMIVGQGRYGTPGHVGMVDQIHEVLHAPDGRLAQVVYSGWEANPQGGRYGRRIWKPGRYSLIQLINLRDPPPGRPQVVPIGFGPLRASLEDADRHRPESRTLGRGYADAMPIRGRGLPELPVAHEILGRSSSFGSVLNVRRIARDREAVSPQRGEAAPPTIPPLPVHQVQPTDQPDLDTEQVLQRLGIPSPEREHR